MSTDAPGRPHDRHRARGAYRRWRYLGRWLCICISLLLVTTWVLQRWPGEAWWGGTLLVYAPQSTWALPLLLVLLGAILTRDRATALTAVLLTPLVLIGLMGLQWRPSADYPGNRVLTVAAWNLRNEWHNAVHARHTLDALGADLVLTQEAIDLHFLPHFQGFECVRSHGQRIFVRRSREYREQASETRYETAGREQSVSSDGPVHIGEDWRLAHEARLEIDGRRVDVLNVHFIVSSRREANRVALRSPGYLRQTEYYRRMQMREVTRWIESREGPWIVAGDFNTPPGARAWRELPAEARDVFAERGRGFGYTYRRGLPLWRIDYIWVSPHFHILDAGVFSGPVSDHLGVWAQLALQERGTNEKAGAP